MTVQKFLDENHDIKHLLLAENERVMETLCTALSGEKITEITLIAKGSTNRSYLVCTTQNSYVLRIPGTGSDEMVDRYREKEIYDLIKDYGIADEIVYLNPESGIKISVYCENARFLDLTKENEVKVRLKTAEENAAKEIANKTTDITLKVVRNILNNSLDDKALDQLIDRSIDDLQKIV